MSEVAIRAIEDADRRLIADACVDQWGTPLMVSRGRQFDISKQQGLIAEADGQLAGFVTFETTDNDCEIGGLLSLKQGIGIGTKLVKALEGHARAARWRRVWLVTTNDNVDGLRFYQKRGFELVAVHRGAVDKTRRTLKPNIPQLGMHGIPLRDEIELEIML